VGRVGGCGWVGMFVGCEVRVEKIGWSCVMGFGGGGLNAAGVEGGGRGSVVRWWEG